jgi:glycosyltransferase involved in cell wall biosynthesis
MMIQPIDLSIVVPAYNERERIGPTLAGYDDWLARAGGSYEIIVVDDGSSDDTGAFVRSLAEARPRLRVIVCRPNRGKGAAVRVGMLAARGRVRVMPWYRVWWSRLGNAIVQRVLVPDVLDTQCGFKAFSAAAATRLFSLARIDGWAFDLELLALAHRWNLRIAEVSVAWADDPRSKIDPLRDAWRNIVEMRAIRRNLRAGVYERGAPALPPCTEL